MRLRPRPYEEPSGLSIDMQSLLARRFIELAGSDGAFERVTRYELALWRQTKQVLLALRPAVEAFTVAQSEFPFRAWAARSAISHSAALVAMGLQGHLCSCDTLLDDVVGIQGEAVADQDECHLVSTGNAVGIEMKDRIRTAHRIPNTINSCCCAAPGEVTGATIT